jgi:hypothetical protein
VGAHNSDEVDLSSLTPAKGLTSEESEGKRKL